MQQYFSEKLTGLISDISRKQYKAIAGLRSFIYSALDAYSVIDFDQYIGIDNDYEVKIGPYQEFVLRLERHISTDGHCSYFLLTEDSDRVTYVSALGYEDILKIAQAVEKYVNDERHVINQEAYEVCAH